LKIEEELIQTEPSTNDENLLNCLPLQKCLKLSRDKICQSVDDSVISAIMGEAIPLHGIHYWEIKLKPDNPNLLKKVYVGLCNINDNLSLENTYKSKSAIMLNCFDSSFWNNG